MIVKREPKRGDVVRVRRREKNGYWHYAIYDNDKRVIHYTSKNSDISKGDNVVSETNFDFFLGEERDFEIVEFPDKYFGSREYLQGDRSSSDLINECWRPINPAKMLTDTVISVTHLVTRCYEELISIGYCHFEPDEVIRRAENKIGENRYRLLTNNCEHFVTWCKTNVPDSKQTSLYEITKKIHDSMRDIDYIYYEKPLHGILF